MTARKKKASRGRATSPATHLRIVTEDHDLDDCETADAGPNPPLKTYQGDLVDPPEEANLVAKSAEVAIGNSLEEEPTAFSKQVLDDIDRENTYGEPSSGQPSNLLSSLDRRQNEVLEGLDRLNAQIDSLILELQQQRGEHQAA